MAKRTIRWSDGGHDYGEAREETGVGFVRSISDKGRVEIDAEHLQEPVTGYAHRDHVPPGSVKVGDRIAYRIVVHRMKRVPADRPFDELGNREKVRDLVEAGSPDQRPSGWADPSNRPDDPPPPPAGATRSEPPPAPPADPPQERTRPAATEGRPWDLHNTDGRLNHGCYALQAAASMVAAASKHLQVARPNQGVHLDVEGAVGKLAGDLLRAADEVQRRTDHGGRVDRMATSHARARSAVVAALDARPVSDKDRLDGGYGAWWQLLVDHAEALLRLAIGLTEQHYAASGVAA